MSLSNTAKLLIALCCFLVAGFLSTYVFQQSSGESFVRRVSNQLTAELSTVEEEGGRIQELWKGDTVPTDLTSYPYYCFKGDRLVYWSDNSFVPSYASVADTFDLKLLKAANSNYLAKKWTLTGDRSLVFIIPLHRQYPITNDYLRTQWNRKIFVSGNVSILEPNASIGSPVCVGNDCPFKISFIEGKIPAAGLYFQLSLLFFGISIVLLIILLMRVVRQWPFPELGVACLYFAFWGVRTAMVRLGFPADWVQTPLFDPQVFASSSLNASLGDLILNELALLLLCFFVFWNYHRFYSVRWLFHHRLISWIVSIFSGLCILFAALFPFVVTQTLYNNSVLTLDITQSIQFDSLRILAFVTVLISGVCSFLFAHAFIRLMIGDGKRLRILVSFAIAIVCFIFINLSTEQDFVSSLVVGVLYFLVVYGLNLFGSLKKLGFATFAYLFVAVFFTSANGAYAIQHFSREEKIDNQFRFASNFLVDRDYFGEFLLAETARKIGDDAFIQTRISSPFFSRDAVRQKIRQVFLPSYFNKYDIEIFLYNAAGEAIDNRSGLTFSELIGEYNKASYRTERESVYFISSPDQEVSQQYLVVVPVTRLGSVSGFVVLKLSLKKVIPENVYPELLVDNRFKQFYRSQDLSYAVFGDGRILFSSGSFNYEQLFPIQLLGEPDLHTIGLSIDGYDHIAQEDENGRAAVVSSARTSWMYVFASFSFLMVLGLVIVLTFVVVQGMVNYLKGGRLYFSARIQLLLNMAFFVPLIIVSLITLGLINRSSQEQLNGEYLTKARTVASQLAPSLNAALTDSTEVRVGFQNQVTDLATLANVDVNVYSADGFLLATSQPLIFENDLLSHYVAASALKAIRQGESLFVETGNVGSLSFFVSYAALQSPLTGKLIGVVGIPFFKSGISLEKMKINILVNTLNIFTVIFIALVVLSYFVSKWLTFPLEFITQSLRRTSLTKVNQPLVWKSDDEIGIMVKEYNQMLYNLSESKAELEQSQRERTWREIAQQVAHEIKNPLTPMKLTLQQLERLLKSGVSSEEKTEKAVSSLLTQVDTLNDIASSFSSFAKMPEPVFQRLDLVSLLQRIVDLHAQSGTIVFKPGSRSIFILGDEQLLGRTFSNLILNAFQAARPGDALVVQINLTVGSSNVLMQFQDNGKGIDPTVAERIFFPHFTTKKSGSGLGLAIAKKAIEQMKGKIWFETEVGKGTSFFIELPLRD